MFENTDRIEVKSIESIAISYGILYEMKFKAKPKRTVIPDKIINGKKTTVVQFDNIKIVGYVVNSSALAGNSKSLLEGLNFDDMDKIELPPTLANIFMDLIDKLGIKLNEVFYLKKEKTENEYKPNLIVEKKTK